MEIPSASPLEFQREIPKKISYCNTCISDFSFDNGLNETTVSPETKVYGMLNINLQPKGGPQVLRQILIGIKEIGAQSFILSERRIIGKRLAGFMGVDDHNRVYENYLNYSKNFVLTAPKTPGLYEVQLGVVEFIAKALEKSGTLYGFFELSSQDQSMLDSKGALKHLWSLEDKIFNISMGWIRVI